MDRFRVFIRDRPNATTGESPIIGEITHFLSFEARAVHNDVGSWLMKVPAGFVETELLLGKLVGESRPGPAGKGIVVYLSDRPSPVFSGPIRKLVRKWGEDAQGSGVFEISGPCDNTLLQERVAWNNPDADIHRARAGSVFYTPVYGHLEQWVADDLNELHGTTEYSKYVCGHTYGEPPENAAEVVCGLLGTNLRNSTYNGVIGRKLNHVVFSWVEDAADVPDDNAGPLIAQSLRFGDIRATVQALGAAYGVGARFLWSPKGFAAQGPYANKIRCTVRRNRDRSERVAFGEQFGNIRAYEYSIEGPTATRVVVGADGDGKDRYFAYEQDTVWNPDGWSDPDGWSATEREWWVTAERFADKSDIDWSYVRDTTKPDPWAKDPNRISAAGYAIDRAAEEVFTDSRPTGSIVLDVIDTPGARYGIDYELGDTVRAVVDGELRIELVTEVRFAQAAGSLTIQPTLGSASTTPHIYRTLRRLWDRVNGPKTIEDLTLPPLDVPTIVYPADGALFRTSDLFAVTGTTLASLPAKLYWAEPPVPGWQGQWRYSMSATADSAGTFTFPNRAVQGEVWTKLKVTVNRAEDGAATETLPFYLAGLEPDGSLMKPAVVSPWVDGNRTYQARVGKAVRIIGYAPPGASLEIEHRVTSGENWTNVEVLKGSTTANANGKFDLTFKAKGPSGGGVAYTAQVFLRVRQKYADKESAWQTTTATGGRTLGYWVYN